MSSSGINPINSVRATYLIIPETAFPALALPSAGALHVAANPEKHPRLRLMLADLSEVM